MNESFLNNISFKEKKSYSDDELLEILAKCHADIGFHMKFFHSDRFSRPFSRTHYQLFEALNDRSVQRICTVAHRGWGKTSIFNYGIPSQYIAFHDESQSGFFVPVSATASVAVMQSENLKRELLSNHMYRTVVGEIKTDDTFSKEAWVTNTNTLVMPRGAGQQVRGLLFKNSRPELIVVDDLENSEEVLSDEQRDKLKSWFMTDLSNCVDRSKNDWRMLIVGTILHESSLLSQIRDSSNWTIFDFPLCDEEYKSYWPQYMTDEQCRALSDEYRNEKKLEDFYMEFMNVVNPAEDATFKAEMFKYYDDGDVDWTSWELDHIVIVDPAKTEKVHNDFTAIVGVTIDTTKNRIYVRDVINKHLTPDQIYKETFDMADRIQAKVVGFEVTGLNEFIRQPMHDYMLSRGKVYDLVELTARSSSAGTYKVKGASKGKASRVGALAPYYRMGWVYHNKTNCSILESQLLQFPKPKYWDVMDAFAYTIEMMELGDRKMSEQYEELALKELDRSEQGEFDRLLSEDDPPIDERMFAEY